MAKMRADYEHNTIGSSIDGKVDEIKETFDNAANQAKSKYDEFAEKAGEAYEDFSEKAGEKYEDLKLKVKDQVNQAIDNAIDSSRKTGQKMKDYVAEKPVQGIGIALAAGVILGYLLTGLRSKKES